MPEQAPVTIVPLGTVDAAEVEAASKRAAKHLGLTVRSRSPRPSPSVISTRRARNLTPGK